MKLLIIGDSLVTGYGLPEGKGWLDLVNEESTEHIVNKGVNGDTTADMLNRFHEDVIQFSPKILFILSGTNDALAGRTANQIYNTKLEMLKQSLDNGIIPIVVLPPFLNVETALATAEDPSYKDAFETAANTIKRFRRLIEDYCMDEHIDTIDLNRAFIDSDIQEHPEKYYVDGVHLTAYAHRKMADKFLYKYNYILVHKNPTDYIVNYDTM
ncbi:MAG TPA: GDSL-type esterase/lipase family protein [Proteiniclasticum sp.]|nr:GDSL-type esterase/lipase family protein [Proteiniclasticum sp.]